METTGLPILQNHLLQYATRLSYVECEAWLSVVFQQRNGSV